MNELKKVLGSTLIFWLQNKTNTSWECPTLNNWNKQ